MERCPLGEMLWNVLAIYVCQLCILYSKLFRFECVHLTLIALSAPNILLVHLLLITANRNVYCI